MGFFLLIFTVINIILTAKNIYLFINVFKHKTHYFVRLGFGGLFKKRLFYLTLGIIRHDDMAKYLVLVRKKGKFKKLARLGKPMKKPDPLLIKSLLKETQIKKVHADILIGTSQAGNTAIFCGVLSIILENVFRIIDSAFKKCELGYVINANYDMPVFSIDADCILKTDIVNTIFRYIYYKIKKVVNDYGKHRKRYAGNNERDQENCRC